MRLISWARSGEAGSQASRAKKQEDMEVIIMEISSRKLAFIIQKWNIAKIRRREVVFCFLIGHCPASPPQTIPGRIPSTDYTRLHLLTE